VTRAEDIEDLLCPPTAQRDEGVIRAWYGGSPVDQIVAGYGIADWPALAHRLRLPPRDHNRCVLVPGTPHRSPP
jgi:hypothetical protein